MDKVDNSSHSHYIEGFNEETKSKNNKIEVDVKASSLNLENLLINTNNKFLLFNIYNLN